MLDKLFTSKTRIKLLLKLFLNPQVSSYLRELASEFELSPNSLKEELDGLSQAGYLDKEKQGRYIYYKANVKHPFFPEINSIVKKVVGIDRIIDQVIRNIGPVESVYILDDYALGVDSGLIDVLIVGDADPRKVNNFSKTVEDMINRRLRVLTYTSEDFEKSKELFIKRPHWKII